MIIGSAIDADVIVEPVRYASYACSDKANTAQFAVQCVVPVRGCAGRIETQGDRQRAVDAECRKMAAPGKWGGAKF